MYDVYSKEIELIALRNMEKVRNGKIRKNISQNSGFDHSGDHEENELLNYISFIQTRFFDKIMNCKGLFDYE